MKEPVSLFMLTDQSHLVIDKTLMNNVNVEIEFVICMNQNAESDAHLRTYFEFFLCIVFMPRNGNRRHMHA